MKITSMSVCSEEVLKLVEKLKDPFPKLEEDELTSIVTVTYARCRVPPLQDPDVPYSAPDFQGIAYEAEINLSIILKVLDYIYSANSSSRQQFSCVFLRCVVVTCLMGACEYCDGSWEWSSPEAASLSSKIFKKLCELYGCNTVPELLVNLSTNSIRKQGCDQESHLGEHRKPDVLKPTLQKLSELLNKDNWKMYPSLKMSYWWILKNISKDDLGEHMANLLPPALFIVDDWENRNKLLGLECLQHILQNTVGSELRWYGRAAVIYDALKPLLYTRDPDVLSSLYPVIIEVAKVLEADPAKSEIMQRESTLDFIMQQLLQEMVHEQKLSLRTVYATTLPILVPALNLYAVRWSEELMDVCGDYLATFEGPLAQDRINILKALQSYVRTCWPQVHRHAITLLKMVVRLLYDVTETDSGVETESAHVITQEAQALVRLLHAAAPSTVQELCAGLHDVEVHPQCRLLIQNIHSITLQEV